jgi:tryptophanyl-tRNA synthetase
MRVLSGFQPSGLFHLGNYFGSIKPNAEFQSESDTSFFIVVDLHSLTTIRDPEELRLFVRENVLDFLACGLDPEHSVLFRQSHVSAHAELAWILSCVSPMGLLARAVSFKEKVEQGIESSVGLFTYPVLQTADIVLYDADKVPVGKDQKQHLEIARDIAGKFNRAYGETFVIPEPIIKDDVALVPGTDGQKMSKSYGNTIPLFGDEKVIQKAIMGITTDSKTPDESKDPSTCVVYQIHKLLLDESGAKSLADEYKNGIGYGDAKKKLFEAYMDYFGEMRKKRVELEKKKDYVEEILARGASKSSEIATKKLDQVKKAVGLSS